MRRVQAAILKNKLDFSCGYALFESIIVNVLYWIKDVFCKYPKITLLDFFLNVLFHPVL